MAEGVPVFFRRYGEGATANYDWTDLAEGTGIVTLYGFTASSAANIEYGLTTAQPYSYKIETSGAGGVGIQVSGAFDTSEFNLSKNVGGTALVTFSYAVINSAGSNSNFPFARVQKVSGGTVSTIGYTSGAVLDSAAGATFSTALKVPISSVHFKKGDILRLNCGVEGSTAGNSPKAIFGTDPQNRDGGYITPSTETDASTKLMFHCPFKIDL